MGVVSTNVCVIKGGSGSGSGADGADLPTHLKSFSANGGNKFVTLSLEYESVNFVSGVQVNYKVGDYPISPSDGNFVTAEGTPATIKITGLTNKLTYYFRAFPYNEVNGTKYYQTDVTNAKVECIPRAVEIIGATPIIEGDDYLVFDAGCTFTITAPAGTKLVLGDGGQGGGNGDYSDDSASQGSYGTASSLKINGQTYDTTGTYDVVATKAGPIGGGGMGGKGGSGSSGQNGDYSGGAGGNGGQGGNGGAALGIGGQGGNGGPGGSRAVSSTNRGGGRGGTGGRGGANGAGTQGSPGIAGAAPTTRYGTSGGTGGAGAPGNYPGIYSYGGNGGEGEQGYYGADDDYAGNAGGNGGNGGRGGLVRTFVLQEDIVNATVVLTIGKGGAGSKVSTSYSRLQHNGTDGGDGVLVVEW